MPGVKYDMGSGQFRSADPSETEDIVAARFDKQFKEIMAIKNAANDMYREKDYARALQGYLKAQELITNGDMIHVHLGEDDAKRQLLQDTRATLLLNIAHMHLRMGQDTLLESVKVSDPQLDKPDTATAHFRQALASCTSVIKVEPANTKALYRRAMAKEHLGMPEDAAEDLSTCVTIMKKNAAKDKAKDGDKAKDKNRASFLQARAALARMALAAKQARKKRSAGWRGTLPPEHDAAAAAAAESEPASSATDADVRRCAHAGSSAWGRASAAVPLRLRTPEMQLVWSLTSMAAVYFVVRAREEQGLQFDDLVGVLAMLAGGFYWALCIAPAEETQQTGPAGNVGGGAAFGGGAGGGGISLEFGKPAPGEVIHRAYE